MEVSTNQSGKVIAAVVIVLVIATAAFIFIISEEPPEDFTPTYPTDPEFPEILPLNNPIFVNNDTDFAAQAELNEWPGTGSHDDPYVISDLSIVHDEPCIHIKSVTSHFIITNCLLHYTAAPHIGRAAIWIEESRNGRVESCIILSQGQGVELFLSAECVVRNCSVKALGAGLNSTSSEFINFLENNLFGCYYGAIIIGEFCINVTANVIRSGEWGVLSQFTNSSLIYNNTISENRIGIDLQVDSILWLIENNTVVNNNESGIILRSQTIENSVFGNRIGWNGINNAFDDGVNNQWDDGISIGNFWSDFDGSGSYIIPGSAESNDHYPSILEDLTPSLLILFLAYEIGAKHPQFDEK